LKRIALVLAGLLLATAANAGVGFVNLGTAAPPLQIAGVPVLPFDLAPQAAIADATVVTAIPGSPIGGSLTLNEGIGKATVPTTWSTWSHGFTGPIFATPYAPGTSATNRTLTLPAGATAFYVYVEPNTFGVFNVECTTNSGVSSGLIPVNGSAGATGFGFYATQGDTLATVTVDVDPAGSGFAIGEFGVADVFVGSPTVIPTLSVAGFAALALALGLAAFVLLRRRRTA